MPAVGAWQYPFTGPDLGWLLDEFDRDLEKLVANHGQPTHVVYESPLKLPGDKLLPLRKIYSQGAHLELWCRRRGIVYEEASPRALKKRLTGDANACKETMVRMCRSLGVPLPQGEPAKDAADGLAAWLVALTHHGHRDHLSRWDQALYSKRGFLA